MLTKLHRFALRQWVRLLVWADLESLDSFGDGDPPMGGAAA